MTIGRIPSVEGGIQPTIFDAKADILTATAADTPARLAVGANDTVLTADSSTATGLKWAAVAGGGKVLQAVSATTSTSTTIASTTYTDTTLTVTITPSAATSKVLVFATQATYSDRATNQTGASIQLVRDATAILSGATNGEGLYYYSDGASSAQLGAYQNMVFLDSPNTTSATTYKVQMKSASTANSGKAIAQINGATSSIVCLEIGA